MTYLTQSLRVWLATLLICAIYVLVVFAVAQGAFSHRADGSIITRDGQAVGSSLVGQNFVSPRYFHPRPSAVGYNGAGGAGSNLAAAGTALEERAAHSVREWGATYANPIPADLVAASGSGLDPDISLAAALWQADRVAAARNANPEQIRALINQHVRRPGEPFTSDPIINVLDLNLALDRLTL